MDEEVARMINELRAYAITHPCATAKDLASLYYARRINGQIAFLQIYRHQQIFSAQFCWHVSVLVPGTLGPKPISGLGKDQKRRLKDTALVILSAVGTGEGVHHWRSGKALHFSRPLNEEELVAHRNCCHDIFSLPIFG